MSDIHKITKSQLESLNKIYQRGGVVASSDWTTGSCTWTACGTPPPFCKKQWAFYDLRGMAGKALKRLLKNRPRIESVVAIIDMRAAKRALRAGGLL